MAISASRGGAFLGIFTALAASGCLDPNPKFEPGLPTASESSDAATSGQTTDLTTESPSTTYLTTGTSTPADSTTTGEATTGVAPACGDGIQEAGEECDEGQANGDASMCTSACTLAKCGDGLVYSSTEACDDGNDDSSDGCIGCQVPRTCKEILGLAGGAQSGAYVIDLDGAGPMAEIPVFCDMEYEGGGWTFVERSPLSDPIGYALFKDQPVNLGDPTNARFRLPKGAMLALAESSQDAWIGCGPDDHLVTAAGNIMAGDMPNPTCENVGPVLYKKAVLKGVVLMNQSLCTGFMGKMEGECAGAWHIDEEEQYLCQLPPYPWSDMVPLASPYADLFAVDPTYWDENLNPNVHTCHDPDSVRVVMLR